MTVAEHEKQLELSIPVLIELIEPSCDYRKTTVLLMNSDPLVVRTVATMMYLGRNGYYNHRKKPYKHPTRVLKSWYDLLFDKETPPEKDFEMHAIIGVVGLRKYLSTAMNLLSIS